MKGTGPLEGITFPDELSSSCVGICSLYVSCGKQLSAPSVVCPQLQLVGSVAHGGGGML
jgi:hypothetical protein